MNRSNRHAFTLIELLIVVAIIGILAAIAVPNFLNAQVKAKVAQCVSNMRSVQTALEMYNLDKGTYPRWAWDGWGNPANHYTGFRDLTTPVTYLSHEAMKNPFMTRAQQMGRDREVNGQELDPYFELGTFKSTGTRYNYNEFPRNTWLLESSGPDTADDYNGQKFPVKGLVYQPSNGLYSKGDIFRSGGSNLPAWASAITY